MIRSLLLVLALVAPVPLAAQETIRVGVIERAPYATTDEAGATTGLAVDLFRLAAEEAGVAWTFVPVDPRERVAALESGLARVVLPVIAAPDLAGRVHLSPPVHTAALAVAEPSGGRIWEVVRGLASRETLNIVLGLSVLLLAVGAIVWLLERRRNAEMFHRDPVRGLGDGFWWAGVTLTTIGYGDKAPATFGGRAVAMLWMLAGLAVSSALTAAIVSVADGGRPLTVVDALEGQRAVAPEGGAAGLIADLRGFDFVRMDDAGAALQRVVDGEADLALGAAPVLAAANSGGLAIRETAHDPVHVTFALRPDDPLAPALDAAILRLHASGAAGDAARRHLD